MPSEFQPLFHIQRPTHRGLLYNQLCLRSPPRREMSPQELLKRWTEMGKYLHFFLLIPYKDGRNMSVKKIFLWRIKHYITYMKMLLLYVGVNIILQCLPSIILTIVYCIMHSEYVLFSIAICKDFSNNRIYSTRSFNSLKRFCWYIIASINVGTSLTKVVITSVAIMKTNEINDFFPKFLSGSDCGIEIPLVLRQTGLLPLIPSLNEFTKSTCVIFLENIQMVSEAPLCVFTVRRTVQM